MGEVSYRWGTEEQGRGQAGRLEEIIISIHRSPLFPSGNASLMFPSLYFPGSHQLFSLSTACNLFRDLRSIHSSSTFHTCSICHYIPTSKSQSCDRLQGLAAHCLVQTPLMEHYTPTVTLVTASCAEGVQRRCELSLLMQQLLMRK